MGNQRRVWIACAVSLAVLPWFPWPQLAAPEVPPALHVGRHHRGDLMRQILAVCPPSLMTKVPPGQSPDFDPSNFTSPAEAPTLAELERFPGLQPEFEYNIGQDVPVQAWQRRREERVQRALGRLNRPDNREWWPDLEVLLQRRPGAARPLLKRLLQSRNPQLVSLAKANLWRVDRKDARLWQAALETTEALVEGDVYWKSRWALVTDPHETHRAIACRALVEGPEVALAILRERPLGQNPDRRQRRAVKLLLRSSVLDDATVDLLAPQFSNLGWLSWDETAKLLGQLAVRSDQPEGPQLDLALQLMEKDPFVFCPLVNALESRQLGKMEPLLRHAWEQSPEDWDLLKALNRCQSSPQQQVADLREFCRSRGQIRELGRLYPQTNQAKLWAALDEEPPSPTLDRMEALLPPRPRQQSVERLRAGYLDLALFQALMVDQPLDQRHQQMLEEVSQRSDAAGGVAAALVGRSDWAENRSSEFLAYFIATSLHRRQKGLDPQVLYRLQEGAPTELFQAIQAYLEADPSPMARKLASSRGRLLQVNGRGLRTDKVWQQPYLAEFLGSPELERLLVLHDWDGDLVVRVGPQRATLTKGTTGSGLELRRDLSPAELKSVAGLPLSPPNPIGWEKGPGQPYPASCSYLELHRGGIHRSSLEWAHSPIQVALARLVQNPAMQPTLPERVPGARLIKPVPAFPGTRVWARDQDIRIGVLDFQTEQLRWSRPDGGRVPPPEDLPALPGSLTTPDGQWTLVNEATPFYGESQAKVRLLYQGLMVFRRGDGWRGLCYIPERNAFLLTNEGQGFALLDPQQFLPNDCAPPGMLQATTDDFEPWLHPCQTYRGRWWVADCEKDGTRVSLYEPHTCRRSSVAFYPGIWFSTEEMWVDGEWVYAAVSPYITRLPLPKILNGTWDR